MNKPIARLRSLPRTFWLYAVVTLIVHIATYWLPNVLNTGHLHVLSTPLDESIPVLPWFIYVYVGAFAFWILSYAYFYAQNRAIARRVFTADLICKAVSFVVFCLFPCTLKRADPEEIRGVGAWLMRLIYASDKVENKSGQLLPSMHCYVSILLAIPVFSKYAGKVPAWLKVFSPLYALAVCLSTLFVKQHVFHDVYTAAILAFAAWFISLYFWHRYDEKHGIDFDHI